MDTVIKDYVELLRAAYVKYFAEADLSKYKSYKDFRYDLVCCLTHNSFEGYPPTDYIESLALRGVFTDTFIEYCEENSVDIQYVLSQGPLLADSLIREAVFYDFLDKEVQLYYKNSKGQ